MRISRKRWDALVDRVCDLEERGQRAVGRADVSRMIREATDKPPDVRPVMPCDEEDANAVRKAALSSVRELDVMLSVGATVGDYLAASDRAREATHRYANLWGNAPDQLIAPQRGGDGEDY